MTKNLIETFIPKCFKEFAAHMKDVWNEAEKVSQEIRLIRPYSLSALSEKNGHIFVLSDFIRMCRDRSFIDYDGHGRYVKYQQISDIMIYPSDVIAGKVRNDFTHIMWFNR